MGPLCATAATLSILKKGSDRALVLPTPTMTWIVSAAERSAVVSTPTLVLAHGALLALLFACWQQRRPAARWATICCAATAIWLQLSAGR
jgi:hypothetical protein